jgi:hypothetical protein
MLRTTRGVWLCLVVASAMFVTACSKNDNGGSNSARGSIQRVDPSGSKVGETLKTTTVSVDNCGGAGPISQTLSSNETITVSIDKIDGQTLSATGTVNLGGFGTLGVGDEISKQYGLTYGQQHSVSDGQTVTVDAGKSVLYTVQTVARFETGTVIITDGSRTERFPYEILTGIQVVATGVDQGCSFLGQMKGRWTFREWSERPGPVTLGMSVVSGTLVVDDFGKAYWDLVLNSGAPPSSAPTPGLRCIGEVNETAKVLSGVTAALVVNGQSVHGDERDWDHNLESLRNDALVAWCGWTFGAQMFVYDTTRSDYQLTLLTAGDAQKSRLLIMKNAAGTFTWVRDGTST